MADHVGTKVSIPGTRGQGILRYYGPINGKNGIFGGIELIGPIAAARGKNSGSVNGVQYFEVQQPMTGLFLPFERLKSVNAHLSIKLRSTSSLRSSTPVEIASTPSPLNRGLNSLLSSDSSITKNGTLRSPYSEKPLINPKRHILKDDGSNAIPKAKSLSENSTSSLVSNGDTKYIDSIRQDTDRIRLEQELEDLKRRYDNNQLEMTEKIKILNDLRNTVNEIQPLLEEYENDLSEKDKKLLKQKSEFEKAREEWRQSLDLMVSTQQENEEYYEQKISELNAKVEEFSNKQPKLNDTELSKIDEKNQSRVLQASLVSKDEEIARYKVKLEDLHMEKSKLEKILNDKINSQRKEIDTLTENLSKLEEKKKNNELGELQVKYDSLIDERESVKIELEKFKSSETSLKARLTELQSDIVQKDKSIENLKSNNSKDDNELGSLVHQVKSVKLDDDNEELLKLKEENQKLKEEVDSKEAMQSKINELENQLEMRPTFEELTDLQNTIDELDDLHKNELKEKDDALKVAIEKKKDLQSQLSDVLQNIEKKNNERADRLEKPEVKGKSDPNELPIHIPKQPIDPSSGKNDWCGLCERDGHSSINCPYENDKF